MHHSSRNWLKKEQQGKECRSGIKIGAEEADRRDLDFYPSLAGSPGGRTVSTKKEQETEREKEKGWDKGKEREGEAM